MKTIKSYLLPLCTLLLIIGGALMPYASSVLQDEQAERTVEVRQFSPVSLNLQSQSDIVNVLQMMPQAYNWFTYTGSTNLTENEAVQSAKDSLQTFSDLVMPIILDSQAGIEVEMGLAVSSEDNEISAILWICNFYNSFIDNYTVFIDDNTGKMVKIVIWNHNSNYEYVEEITDGNKQIAILNNINTIIDAVIDKWKIFCQDYYGIEIINIVESVNWDSQQYNFEYTDNNDIYNMPLIITKESIVFN